MGTGLLFWHFENVDSGDSCITLHVKKNTSNSTLLRSEFMNCISIKT